MRGAVRLLGAVAATPFVAVAVVHCAGNAPDPKVGQGEASAVASSAATTATATDSTPPALTASGAASPSSSSSPQSTASGSTAPAASGGSVLGDTWSRSFPTGAGAQGKCGDLARAHAAFLEAHRGCKTSSECVAVNASCGLAGVCGAPMSSAFRAGLQAKDKAFTDANCMAILAAPCPSCASRGTPACVAGKCEFVR